MNFGDAVSRRFSRGDNADDIARRAIAVSYHQQAKRIAQPERGSHRALRHGKINRPSDESVVVQGQPAIRLGIGPTERGQKQRATGELEQRSANVYK